MPRSKVNDELLVREGEGLEPHDQDVGSVPDGGIECRRQVLGLSDVEKLGLEAQGSRGDLDLLPLRWKSRVAHVEEGRDSRRSWNQVTEQLDSFCIELRHDG